MIAHCSDDWVVEIIGRVPTGDSTAISGAFEQFSVTSAATATVLSGLVHFAGAFFGILTFRAGAIRAAAILGGWLPLFLHYSSRLRQRYCRIGQGRRIQQHADCRPRAFYAL